MITTNDRIGIFGNGQMGNLYLDHYNQLGIVAEILKADITNIAQVNAEIERFRPTVIINTAAKTNLEWCGNNQLQAFNVNVLGTNNIAQVCDELGVYFIHLSSGCIFQSFNSDDEKFEDSAFDAQSYYSLTKIWSEQIIPFRKSNEFKYVILRPRQPISTHVSAKNMLIKMLTFAKFIDTANTGTVLEDLLEWTDVIIEKRATGVYHVANPGWMTPYQIGMLLKEIINPAMEPIKISKAELDKMTPNTRVDTVLNVDKLKSLGITPRPYAERMREVITQLKVNLDKMDKTELKKILTETANTTAQRSTVNDVWPQLCD